MNYSLNKFKFIAMVIAIGMMAMVGTASADISGNYVPAENLDNTFLSSDGTSSMANVFSGGVLWRDTGDEILGTSGFAYEPNSTDAEVVTTITGLMAGQAYEIDLIIGDYVFATYSVDAGFVSGSLDNYAEGDPSGTDTFLNSTGGANIFELSLGTISADGNGDIQVFVAPDGNGGRFTYNGVAFTPVAVPEPGSLALLGLFVGGLGLIRRR